MRAALAFDNSGRSTTIELVLTDSSGHVERTEIGTYAARCTIDDVSGVRHPPLLLRAFCKAGFLETDDMVWELDNHSIQVLQHGDELLVRHVSTPPVRDAPPPPDARVDEIVVRIRLPEGATVVAP